MGAIFVFKKVFLGGNSRLRLSYRNYIQDSIFDKNNIPFKEAFIFIEAINACKGFEEAFRDDFGDGQVFDNVFEDVFAAVREAVKGIRLSFPSSISDIQDTVDDIGDIYCTYKIIAVSNFLFSCVLCSIFYKGKTRNKIKA